MTVRDDRIRAFVYNEDQLSADKLAMSMWENGFECWPFCRLEAMASSFREYPPRLAILEMLSEQEALQVVVLLAALCPDCRFIAFADSDRATPQLAEGYRRGSNFEIFALAPTEHEILTLAHVAKEQLSTP